MVIAFAIGVVLALTTGCAGMGLPKAILHGGVSPERNQRREQVAQLFDQQRDVAEYEAAKAQWEQQNDPEGCRKALEKLLARNTRHRDARLLLAELLLSEEDPQGAYKHAKAALDLYPNDGRVQYTVGLSLDAAGNTSDALAYYERATKMAPNDKAFAAAYETARESARDDVRKSKSRAIDASETGDMALLSVVAAGHTSPAAPANAPAAQAESSAAPKSADFSGIAEDDPALKWLRKGQAALAEVSPQTALEHFRQAAATKPDNSQIPISAAGAALRANRPEVAVALLTAAAKQFPNAAAVHRMLGAAHYRTGDYKSSQVALQQALSLDKSSALTYLLMGYTLAKLGQGEASEAHFRQARTLDSSRNLLR